MDEIAKSILFTIKYFDLFEYPLTIEEVRRWLFCHKNIKTLKHKNKIGEKAETPPIGRAGRNQKLEIRVEIDELINNGMVKGKGEELGIRNYELSDFKKIFEELKGNKIIQEIDGLYFLSGRDRLVEIRKEREKISLKKIRKAQRVAGLLALVPGIKMISVCSNLGYLNAPIEADIDLFIITRKGMIWLSRFWSVVLIKLLGWRPKGNKQKDKICLSYFTDEENMDLSKTKVGETDIHLAYLTAQNLIIYDEGGYFEKFKAANKWLRDYLPNFDWEEAEKFKIKNIIGFFKKAMEMTVTGAEERILKKIQLFMLNPELRGAANRGDQGVIINDGMLKLHLNDKRKEINEKIEKFE